MTDFERESHELLAELEQEHEKLEKRAKIAQENLEMVNRKIATLKEGLAIFRAHHNLPEPATVEQSTHAQELRNKLKDLSTKEMLVKMAQENGNILRVAEVSRILHGLGFFKDRSNASGNVYVTMRRNPQLFRKIDKGVFELVQSLEPEPEKVVNGKR